MLSVCTSLIKQSFDDVYREACDKRREQVGGEQAAGRETHAMSWIISLDIARAAIIARKRSWSGMALRGVG